MDTILASVSESTLKQYCSGLKKWWEFTQGIDHNPLSFNLKIIVKFINTSFEAGCSFSTINSYKCALSLMFHMNNQDKCYLKRYLKGIYNNRPSAPRYRFTWDPHVVLIHLEKMFPLESISLKDLTLKLITLLALTSGQRLQTFSKIKLHNIIIQPKMLQIKIDDKLKTSNSKNFQPILSFPFFTQKPELCVAKTLLYYIDKTKSIRPTNEQKLLVTYKSPHKAANVQSLSRWIKSVLRDSGVDVNLFSSYSVRHASTSAAHRGGTRLEVIRKAAGWSDKSDTFNKFYNRPVIPQQFFAEGVFKGAGLDYC